MYFTAIQLKTCANGFYESVYVRKWHLVGKILDKTACRRNNENKKPVKTTIVVFCVKF